MVLTKLKTIINTVQEFEYVNNFWQTIKKRKIKNTNQRPKEHNLRKEKNKNKLVNH